MFKYFVELKNRLLLMFFSCILLTSTSYAYKEVVLFFISESSKILFSNSNYFIYTNITEILYSYLQTLTFINTQFCILYLGYNAITFLSPAFFKHEYLMVTVGLKLSFLVWLVASLFFNFYFAPAAVSFLSGFQESTHFNLYLEAKLNEFLSVYFLFFYFFTAYTQFFVLLVLFFCRVSLGYSRIRRFRKIYHYSLLWLVVFTAPSDLFIQFPVVFSLITFFECLLLFTCLKKYYPNVFLKDCIT